MQNTRIFSIDLLRGIIMLLMALDHVRDYFHIGAFRQNPLDLETTTPALFFTRWITHYCAPVFIFLAGISACLYGSRKPKKELARFLITRGLWLIVMEITLVSFGWTFNIASQNFLLQVIWAIGISMIFLGLLVWLPAPVILISGLLIVAGHNLLDYVEQRPDGSMSLWLDILHCRGFSVHPLTEHRNLIIIYGFLPWMGIMFCGYGIGRIFTSDYTASQRKNILLTAGIALLLVFVILRYMNGYGDRHPWAVQDNFLYTLLSFVNVTKYTPSLLYTCMTIGPALILLAVFEKSNNTLSRKISVFGRVPFFYYLAHIYVIHLLTLVCFYLSGYTSADIVSPNSPFLFRPQNFGYGLGTTYLIWIGIILALYPLCSMYKRYKSTHKHWWLSYL